MGEKFQPRPASELKDRYDTVIIGSGGRLDGRHPSP